MSVEQISSARLQAGRYAVSGADIKPNPLNVLHAFYIFCMFNALFPMLFNGPSDLRDFVLDRTPALNYFYLAVHLVYVPIFVRHVQTYRNLSSVLIIPTFITALVLVSVVWSLSPARSAVMGILFALQLLIVSYIVSTNSLSSFIRILSWSCFAACLLSLIAIFIIPSYGKMTYVFPGAWQGVFIHKNVLGRFAIFSMIVFVVLYRSKKSFVDLLGIFLSLVLAVGCGSSTALLGVVGVAGVTVVSIFRKLIVPAIIVCVAAVVFYFSNEDYIQTQLATFFGKTATLSGRTTIWAAVLEAINLRPLTGFGMGAFWGSEYAVRVRDTARWFVPHAHNGFLEVGLQLGYPGMILFAAAILQLLIGALRYMTIDKRPFGTWPLYVVFFCLLYGAGEANFLRPNSFVQVVLYASIAYVLIPFISKRQPTSNMDVAQAVIGRRLSDSR